MSTSDLTLLSLRALALSATATLVFALSLPVARIAPIAPTSLGMRGRNRVATRLAAPLFVRIEPLLTRLAGIIRLLPLSELRVSGDRLLRRSGEAAGLCADELIALTFLTLLGGTAIGAWFVGVLHLPAYWLPLLILIGVLAPTIRLDGIARDRAKALERSLPSAMDLCVLCMGAGTDFPSALAFATRELGLGHEVCREELSVLLEQLSLGRTRVEALEDLSLRSGSQTVQQFVAAVCQSETKGTPLVEALTIQSSTLRQRRSVLAEEMAAKAGVRMMLPLMLMVCSVLLVIFGPFIVNGIGL